MAVIKHSASQGRRQALALNYCAALVRTARRQTHLLIPSWGNKRRTRSWASTSAHPSPLKQIAAVRTSRGGETDRVLDFSSGLAMKHFCVVAPLIGCCFILFVFIPHIVGFRLCTTTRGCRSVPTHVAAGAAATAEGGAAVNAPASSGHCQLNNAPSCTTRC